MAENFIVGAQPPKIKVLDYTATPYNPERTLSLTLLMLRVFAYYHYTAVSLDYLALVAHRFY